MCTVQCTFFHYTVQCTKHILTTEVIFYLAAYELLPTSCQNTLLSRRSPFKWPYKMMLLLPLANTKPNQHQIISAHSKKNPAGTQKISHRAPFWGLFCEGKDQNSCTVPSFWNYSTIRQQEGTKGDDNIQQNRRPKFFQKPLTTPSQGSS